MGNLDLQTAANGVITDYVYDSLNRLDLLTHYLPDATPADLSDNQKLAEFDYTVRADGKRTAVTETFYFDDNADGIPDPHVNQIDWTYDNAGRLVDEVFNHYDDLLDQTEHFTLDLTGNRLQRTVDKANDGTIDAVFTSLYDENDRLLTEQVDSDNNGTIDQTTTFGYTGTQQTSKTVTDTALNTQLSTLNYSYNLQGRMSHVAIDSFDPSGNLIRHQELGYEYNPDGIRITALDELDTDADGAFDSRTLTEYLIDPNNHTGYQQVLEETVTDAETGVEIKKTVYTIGHDHISQTTFTPTGPAEGETLTFHHDGHGSTRVLTDAAAAIATVAGLTQLFHYTAHGNPVGFDPTDAATTFLYSGEQTDPATGQQYLRARYYDAATGTFNRLDPFAGNLTDPQSLHKYLYTHADPINNTDPTGQFIGAFFAIGVGLLAGGLAYSQAGFSLGESALIGLGVALSVFVVISALAVSPFLVGATGWVLLAARIVSFIIGASGTISTARWVFMIALNMGRSWFNPEKASTLNQQWLNDFDTLYAAAPAADRVTAKIALKHLLDVASNTQTPINDPVTILLSLLDKNKGVCLCGDWAFDVWGIQRDYSQLPAGFVGANPIRDAFNELGIKISIEEYSTVYGLNVHYLIQIELNPPMGPQQKWLIDNGWASLDTAIDAKLDLDKYAVGVPFLESDYNPNANDPFADRHNSRIVRPEALWGQL